MNRTIAVFAMAMMMTSSLTAADLDVNDVSILWPLPTHASDLATIIKMDQLNDSDGEPVWTDSQFNDIVTMVREKKTTVDGIDVTFRDPFDKKAAWFVAGMRVDPSAPGCSDEVRENLSCSTQIRLIVQPVLSSGGSSLSVRDTAIHLVYSWNGAKKPNGLDTPDDAKFSEIVADLEAIKQKSADGGALTEDLPLGIHPGLDKGTPGVHAAIRAFLVKHLREENLRGMALMGIRGDFEPWIFLGTRRDPATNKFVTLPAIFPTAKPQMLTFLQPATRRVSPVPENDNLSDIKPLLPVPAPADRRGVSTAPLFAMNGADFNRKAVVSTTGVEHDTLKNGDIADVIANPELSHFFNTDCVSCHTETRLRMNKGLPLGSFAFTVHGESPAIAPTIKPTSDWNVRNFGWFRRQATVTQRTANETAEVLEFVNERF